MSLKLHVANGLHTAPVAGHMQLDGQNWQLSDLDFLCFKNGRTGRATPGVRRPTSWSRHAAQRWQAGRALQGRAAHRPQGRTRY